MKNRKLKLVATISGFDTLIAEVKLQNFADEIDVKEWTELVCPICGKPTEYHGGYVCPNDKSAYNHWSKLKRVIRGTAKALTVPHLLKDKEEAVGRLSYIPFKDFAKNFVDATRQDGGEKGITLVNTDSASAKNLFKLLVAVERLKCVIIAKWNDTTEEVVGLLTVSASGRILIREIIPSNLVQVRETLFIDPSLITEGEVEEAKQFIEHFIPKATPETFAVADYRAQWKDGIGTTAPVAPEPQKVADIKAIMAQLKVEVEVPASKPKKKVK